MVMLVVESVYVINVKLDILYFCFVLLMLAVGAVLVECFFFRKKTQTRAAVHVR